MLYVMYVYVQGFPNCSKGWGELGILLWWDFFTG